MGENTFICLHELHIEAIEFDKSEFVTLFCQQSVGVEHTQFELDCHFSQLDNLLRIGGQEGETIAMELADRLARPGLDEEEILEISLVIGDTLTLQFHDFVMYEAEAVEKQFDYLKANPTKVYCLDRFYPAKKFTYGTVDYDKFVDIMKPHSLKLTQLYYNYLNARKNGYTEWEARKMFGLERNFFFVMAKEIAEMWD